MGQSREQIQLYLFTFAWAKVIKQINEINGHINGIFCRFSDILSASIPLLGLFIDNDDDLLTAIYSPFIFPNVHFKVLVEVELFTSLLVTFY